MLFASACAVQPFCSMQCVVLMLFASLPVVKGDWEFDTKIYENAQCAGQEEAKISDKGSLTSTHVHCITHKNPMETKYRKEQRTCEGGSVVTEGQGTCTDNTCSICTGTKGKKTQTSAEFDKEMSSVSAGINCVQQKDYPGTYAIRKVSGLAPANPCTTNTGQRVSSSLQATVVLLTLLSSAVAWQQAE